MKNNQYRGKILKMTAGIVLVGIDLIFINMAPFAYSKVLIVFLAVVGFGVFGYYLGEIGQMIALGKDPQASKKLRIEQNDERNLSISNMAKGKAFDAMGLIFGALIIMYALLDFDFVVLLPLVGAYLLVYGIMIYYLLQLHKKM